MSSTALNFVLVLTCPILRATEQVMMNQVMADFDRKLALLSSQTECPVCFDAFAAEGEKRAEVLGCCHSVCKDCWKHIQQLAPGRPLCPMCRYEDFYVAISEAA